MPDEKVVQDSADPADALADGDTVGPSPSQRLARRLRHLRTQQQISLHQLARRSGVSTATLSGLEAGRGNPTLATLLALAPALGVSVADLLREAARQQR